MTAELINKINKIYNICLKLLLNVKLNRLLIKDQLILLKLFSLLPFQYRSFYRFSLFSYKILNRQILFNFSDRLSFKDNIHCTRESARNIYVPYRHE